jgi:gas vesicle protein
MLKFVIGILCGVAAGLLLAPAAGSETREELMQRIKDPASLARDKVRQIREQAGEMGANMGRQAAQRTVDKIVPESLNQRSA